MALVEELPLWPISSESELDHAIEMLDRLLDEENLSAGGKAYLEVLTRLVSDSTISSILNGKRKLTRGQIETLSKYFSVSSAVFQN